MATSRPFSLNRGKPLIAASAPCESCGKRSTLKVYRLDPRNLHPSYRMLCRVCSQRLGFTPVDWNRSVY